MLLIKFKQHLPTLVVWDLERIRNMECNCGSGEPPVPYYDARMIFLCYACDICWPNKRKQFRDDVWTNPDYPHSEPIDDE